MINLELFSNGAGAAAVERAIKQRWRVERGLPAFAGREDMPQTGGWSETVAADTFRYSECVERIRKKRAAWLTSASKAGA